MGTLHQTQTESTYLLYNTAASDGLDEFARQLPHTTTQCRRDKVRPQLPLLYSTHAATRAALILELAGVETGAGHVVVRVLARGVRGQAVSHTSSSGTRGNLIVLRSSRTSARFDFTCTLEMSFTRRPCREAAT